MSTDGTWTYTYDNRGNEMGKTNGTGTGWAYSYDNNNQMTTAVETVGTTVVVRATYTYDAFGNRIKTDVTQNGAETVTEYAYDGWNPGNGGGTVTPAPGVMDTSTFNMWASLTVSGGTQTLQMRYIYVDGVNQLFAQISGGGTGAWLLTDHLGSVVGETSASGQLQFQQSFDAYGNVSNSTVVSGTPLPVLFGWQGMQFDAWAGLDYDKARFYDFVVGRFTSEDPLGDGTSNPYEFAGNDPLNASDPSGLQQWGLGPGQDHSVQAFVNTIFNIDTLWWLIGYEPGGTARINGGVHERFARDQAWNLVIALPPTRAGAMFGTGYDALSQGAGNLGDLRQGRPLRGFDTNQNRDMAMLGGAAGPLFRLFPPLIIPATGGALVSGGNRIRNGEYEEGAVDLGAGLVGLRAIQGRYFSRSNTTPAPGNAPPNGQQALDLLLEPPGGATLRPPAGTNAPGVSRGAGTSSNPPPSSGQVTPRPGDPAFRGPLPRTEVIGRIETPRTVPHQVAQETLTQILVESRAYRRVYRSTALSRVSGRQHDPNIVPDVIGERWNGQLDLFEIRSPSQTVRNLRLKLEHALGELAPTQQGVGIVLDPPANRTGGID
jgi:RHS repeat-associated protein